MRRHAAGARPIQKTRGSRSPGQKRLTLGVGALAAVMVSSALIVAGACAPETKHRILVFLYDGVPPLHESAIDVAPPPEAAGGDGAAAPVERVDMRKKYFVHPHYKEKRCESCHDSETGQLLRTVRAGLCIGCHTKKPRIKKFVHGPVAVNDCMVCHRYHKSVHEKLLLDDAQTVCMYCHEGEVSAEDEHHATMDKERCIDCHDPHGGDDRFFLIKKPEQDGTQTDVREDR